MDASPVRPPPLARWPGSTKAQQTKCRHRHFILQGQTRHICLHAGEFCIPFGLVASPEVRCIESGRVGATRRCFRCQDGPVARLTNLQFNLKITKGNTIVAFEKLWFLQKGHALRFAIAGSGPEFDEMVNRVTSVVEETYPLDEL